jgi:DNA-directed RNA polymerase specialized sigma24 family protein
MEHQPAGAATAEQADSFATFFSYVEPRLRRALVARYGHERGREATAEALTWAWQHWPELASVENPIGYLYRVGQSKSRLRRERPVFERPAPYEQLVEPGLEAALALLSERQRVVLLLVYGSQWTHAEVAELLGVGVSTIQKHVERGRLRLRKLLKAEEWNS